MPHPSTHPYPLPFPSEDQIIRISSYSSLANALGTAPGHTSRQGRTQHLAGYDSVTNTLAVYSDGPPVGNPFYPYPARNVLNPGTYPARTPLSMSNGRCPSNVKVVRDESNNRTSPAEFRLRYERLPQQYFAEQNQTGPEFPTIHFQREGNREPYSLRDLLTMRSMPDLVAGDLPIFAGSPERCVKVKLNWPGYSRHPFEKRIPTKRDVPLTRTLLLMKLAYDIEEFVRWIQNERAIVEPGQERWSVTEMPSGARSTWKDGVITSLRHREGSIWQVEIYYLRR